MLKIPSVSAASCLMYAIIYTRPDHVVLLVDNVKSKKIALGGCEVDFTGDISYRYSLTIVVIWTSRGLEQVTIFCWVTDLLVGNLCCSAL